MTAGRIPSVEGGIQPTLLTTKGDLISATAASTVARLAVGTDGQTLVADSTASTGLAYKSVGVVNGLTTTGDTIYSSSGTTQSRLGIGSTGQVLTVASGAPSWATPASGSMTSLATGSISGASVSITSISGSYKNLILDIVGISFASTGELRFTFNSYGSAYGYTTISNGVATGSGGAGSAYGSFGGNVQTFGDNVHAVLQIPNYSTSAARQIWTGQIGGLNASNGGPSATFTTGQAYNAAAVITSIQFFPASGNFNSAGTYTLYGVN